MGSDELIANLFRITQTESKLKKDNVKLEKTANETHYKVGKKIRKTIEELGRTMPEELRTPDKSLKEIERDNFKIRLNNYLFIIITTKKLILNLTITK